MIGVASESPGGSGPNMYFYEDKEVEKVFRSLHSKKCRPLPNPSVHAMLMKSVSHIPSLCQSSKAPAKQLHILETVPLNNETVTLTFVGQVDLLTFGVTLLYRASDL